MLGADASSVIEPEPTIDWINLIQWPAMKVTVAAAWLVASQRKLIAHRAASLPGFAQHQRRGKEPTGLRFGDHGVIRCRIFSYSYCGFQTCCAR